MAQARTYATFYSDPPPGAGNLGWGGFSFAELGTARRTDGQATGHGWIARLFGVRGELPIGFGLWVNYHGVTVYARKQDRGYGQGGNGIVSDGSFALDLYDGSAYGLPNLPAALGWRPNDWVYLIADDRALANLRSQQGSQPPTAGGPTAPAPTGIPPEAAHDYHAKVQQTGQRHSQQGQHFRGHAAALRGLLNRHSRL